MTKKRQVKSNDICIVKSIKENKNYIVHNENIKNQWWEYFDELFINEKRHVVRDIKTISFDENMEFMASYEKYKFQRSFNESEVRESDWPITC